MAQDCLDLFLFLRRRLRVIAHREDFIFVELLEILHIVLVIWDTPASAGHAKLVIGYAYAFLLLGPGAIIRVRV